MKRALGIPPAALPSIGLGPGNTLLGQSMFILLLIIKYIQSVLIRKKLTPIFGFGLAFLIQKI